MGKKKGKKNNLGRVIIPTNHPNPPEPHEIEAAWILARHFQCEVEFLVPVDDYMRKTADLVMRGVEWEMKSPIGASKSTIGNQFSVAKKQSKNIIIDTRRTALDYEMIVKKVMIELKKRSNTKRVICNYSVPIHGHIWLAGIIFAQLPRHPAHPVNNYGIRNIQRPPQRDAAVSPLTT